LSYTRNANKGRLPAPDYRVNDKVFLDSRHIRSTRPSRKLDYRWLGPFVIDKIINPVAFRLQLPPTWRIHPVFHVSLLKPAPAHSPLYSSQELPPPPPVVMGESDEYEVETILDSRVFRGRPQFLVHWKGYPISERTWEPRQNLQHCSELLADFHLKYPSKPF
jgi:hypothetical protein